jgi:hypothetical protein
MNNWHLLLVSNSKEIIQVFQLMLIMCYSQPGLGENNGSEMCANTESFGKFTYNFNNGNNGVLVEGSWVGDLWGD